MIDEDIYLALFTYLIKKAKPISISTVNNINFSPYNTTSRTTSFANGGSQTESFMDLYTYKTNVEEKAELKDKAEFLEKNSKGNLGNKKTRLDFINKKYPSRRFREIVINHLLENNNHNLQPREINLIVEQSNNLSLYTIKQLFETASNVYSLRYQDSRLCLAALIEAAIELGIEISLQQPVNNQNDNNSNNCAIS